MAYLIKKRSEDEKLKIGKRIIFVLSHEASLQPLWVSEGGEGHSREEMKTLLGGEGENYPRI
jgi:hypothetical protein